MFFSCSHLALCFTCSLESVFCAFLLHLQHFCSFAHNLLVLYIYIYKSVWFYENIHTVPPEIGHILRLSRLKEYASH